MARARLKFALGDMATPAYAPPLQACKAKSSRAERQKVLDELGDALKSGSIICLQTGGCYTFVGILDGAYIKVEEVDYPISPCHIKRGNASADS